MYKFCNNRILLQVKKVLQSLRWYQTKIQTFLKILVNRQMQEIVYQIKSNRRGKNYELFDAKYLFWSRKTKIREPSRVALGQRWLPALSRKGFASEPWEQAVLFVCTLIKLALHITHKQNVDLLILYSIYTEMQKKWTAIFNILSRPHYVGRENQFTHQYWISIS